MKYDAYDLDIRLLSILFAVSSIILTFFSWLAVSIIKLLLPTYDPTYSNISLLRKGTNVLLLVGIPF